MQKLDRAFYQQPSVVHISQQLLGKYVCTQLPGGYTSGLIVETEAYCGASDKACHAHFNRFTNRTRIMFGPAGHAYVYLCYGIHSLFNIVTNVDGMADAVLVRAIEPAEGLETMLQRRNMQKADYRLTAGPGTMAQAMGIGRQQNGADLTGDSLWIEDRGIMVPASQVVDSPRVGIDYAEGDALLPWRFRIKGNPWCSRAKATSEKKRKKR